MAAASIFAAIVGVPYGEESPCQGRGSELQGCLEHDYMQLEVKVFETPDGIPYRHLKNACERVEGETTVEEARPGRRYVKVAQSFGPLGYVYSFCNQDWTPAMTDIAQIIREVIDASQE